MTPLLTAGEMDVLRLMAQNKSYPVIAEELGLPIHTVVYRAQVIRDRLGASNRAQVLQYATRADLLAEVEW